jgi:peptidoglycan/xylan/chitin deacetylase (PgdA/CDA1 family)
MLGPRFNLWLAATHARRIAISVDRPPSNGSPIGLTQSTCAGSGARVIVVFRNDDISACADVEHERRVAAIFERYSLPQTIGVIPHHAADSIHDPYGTRERPLGTNAGIVAFLHEHVLRTGSEIALHGYTHRTNLFSRPSRREYFEFRGLSARDQGNRIRLGTALIERVLGVRPRTFIPPWNRLDRDTLVALLENEYEVVSAGPFTPSAARLIGLGTNCDLKSFPEAFRVALDSGHRVLLRVLYHSPMLRHPDELRALKLAVCLAADTPHCEVLSLAEAVRRYPEDVRVANEAARNIVPQDEVVGTPRARAAVYVRMCSRFGFRTSLGEAYRSARALHHERPDADVAALSPAIDRLATRLLASARVLAAAAAAVGGASLAGLLPVLEPSLRFGVYGFGSVLVAAIGVFARWQATSSDTRAELSAVTFTAVIVGSVSAAAFEMMRALIGY